MNRNMSGLAIFIILTLAFASVSYAQVSPSSWSIKSSYLYMSMKMSDYNNYANRYNSMVGKQALKPLKNASGGIIELRTYVFRKISAGIETGFISGRVESNGNIISSRYNGNSVYQHKLSLTSVPINVNFYYSFIKTQSLNVYSGFSSGVWSNKISFTDIYDYSDDQEQSFWYGKDNLTSRNFSYSFQLGSDYRLFNKLGIDLKVSYRSANFKGFRGDSKSRFIDVNHVRNTSRFDKLSQKIKLMYDQGNGWLSTSPVDSGGGNEAHINMGNWGIGVGLMWYFKGI